jgi:hypothetical protein
MSPKVSAVSPDINCPTRNEISQTCYVIGETLRVDKLLEVFGVENLKESMSSNHFYSSPTMGQNNGI